MPSFAFFVRFFVLIVIGQSVIFSCVEEIQSAVEKAPASATTSPPVSPVLEATNSLSEGLPQNYSDILLFLGEANPKAIQQLFGFVERVRLLEQNYNDKMRGLQSDIENISREVLREKFIWGTISVLDAKAGGYKWSSEDALRLQPEGYEYWLRALEIRTLINAGLANPYLHNPDIGLPKFTDALDSALALCKIKYAEIEVLKESLARMSKFIPMSLLDLGPSVNIGDCC